MPQYVKTVWVNGTVPALNDSNLNKMEQGIFDSLRQDGSTTMSGQLVTTAGSAATPAIAPTGDANTGIFFPAADTISFSKNGAEYLRFSGNLEEFYSTTTGAGTVAETQFRMDVGGGNANSKVAKIQAIAYSPANQNSLAFFVGDWNNNNNIGTEKMRITSTGNVGIGTTSPAYTLDANGIVRAKNAFYIGRSTDSAVIGSVKEGTSNGLKIQAESGGTDSTITFATNGGDRAIITSAGNVGIGTTNPDTLLHIKHSSQPTITFEDSSANKGYLDFNSTRMQLHGGSGSIYFVAGSSEKMRITSAGNVGIGTTSPSAKLEVAGTKILLSGSSVNSTIGISDASCNYNFNMFTQSADIAQLSVINKTVASGSKDLWITASSHNFNTWNGSAYTTRALIDTNGYLLVGYTSSNGAYPLQVNGQIFATSSTIATSDGRYKKDVVALDGALDIVKALNPVQFSWKDHPVHKFNTDVPTVGFIAQEVEQALADKSYLTSIIKKSECTWETETGEFVEREVTRDVEKQVEREVEREVTETIDGEEVTRTITEEVTETVIEQVTEIVQEPVKETHTEEFLGIAESNLIAILTKAVKELAAEVEALKAQLNGN